MATWTALCWGVTVRWLETDDSRRPFCKLLENHWGADKFVLHRKDTMLDAEVKCKKNEGKKKRMQWYLNQ